MSGKVGGKGATKFNSDRKLCEKKKKKEINLEMSEVAEDDEKERRKARRGK